MQASPVTNKHTPDDNQVTSSGKLQEQRMFEYDQLRKEILQTDIVTLQILGGVVVITIGLMSIAFSEQLALLNEVKPLLFFLAETVALIGLAQNTDRVRSTIVIASYIRNLIEVDLAVQWETRLAQFRRIRPKDMRMNLMTQQRLVYLIIMLANALLGCYYLDKVYLVNSSFLLAAGIVLVILSASAALYIWQWRKCEHLNSLGVAEYDDIWKGMSPQASVQS